jgi:hypothetical protein
VILFKDFLDLVDSGTYAFKIVLPLEANTDLLLVLGG